LGEKGGRKDQGKRPFVIKGFRPHPQTTYQGGGQKKPGDQGNKKKNRFSGKFQWCVSWVVVGETGPLLGLWARHGRFTKAKRREGAEPAKKKPKKMPANGDATSICPSKGKFEKKKVKRGKSGEKNHQRTSTQHAYLFKIRKGEKELKRGRKGGN